MREILFRGKAAVDTWIESDSILQFEDHPIKKCRVVTLFQADEGWVEVIPETVGQYTGLTDKNGKKIFEGDIVKWDGTEISQIRYCDGVYRLCNAQGYYGVAIHNHYSYVEVIGNIHDNPDLMKGGAE